MEITCEQCGKRYRVDVAKLGKGVNRLKCRICNSAMTVVRPEAERPRVSAEAPPASPTDPVRTPKQAAFDGVPPDAEQGVKFRFGLTFKMVAVMLLVSLLPFGIFVGLTFQESRDRTLRDTELIMGETARGLGREVDEWLDKNLRALRLAAELPSIRSMDPGTQEPVLKAIHETYPYMYLVFTLDPQGMNLARNDGEALRSYSDRAYYQGIASGREFAWQTLIGKTSKKPALVLAVPIRENGRLVGVMASAMMVDDISKSVAAWRNGQTGFAFLVDETGKVVSHQFPEFVESQRDISSHPLVSSYRNNGRPEPVAFIDDDGVAQRGFVYGNSYGWVLGVQQSADEIFAPYRKEERFALYVFLATILLVSFIAYFAGRSIVRPINKLTEIANRMSMGVLDATIDVRSNDEIGRLARAIGRMQTSLKLAIERLRRRS